MPLYVTFNSGRKYLYSEDGDTWGVNESVIIIYVPIFQLGYIFTDSEDGDTWGVNDSDGDVIGEEIFVPVDDIDRTLCNFVDSLV